MGLKLIIAALEDSLFSRAHNDMAALAPHVTYYRRFSCPDIPNIRLQLHFLLWFILNPAARHSMRLNVKNTKWSGERIF